MGGRWGGRLARFLPAFDDAELQELRQTSRAELFELDFDDPRQIAFCVQRSSVATFIPVGETHAVAPGSSTGLADAEYAITLNPNFLTQTDHVIAGANTFTARYDYDNDTVLRCAGHGTTCSETNGVVYHFDNGPGDALPSGHGLLEGTTSGAITESFTYNPFGELATQVVGVSGTPLITTTYDDATAPRDALGRITTRAVTRHGQTRAVTYGYDAKGQLLTVSTEGEPTLTNEYDANGNRLCTYEAPATGCAAPAIFDAQDRLLSYDGVEYRYTDRGSLFQRDDGSTLETFTYDALGNLTRVERDGGSTIDYTIDAQGRRVGKHVDGALKTQYVWSGALRIGAELDAFGGVTSRFIYGSRPNVPDLVVKPNAGGAQLYRVITDHLGSPIYVVNIADPNDVLLEASYDEWGKVTAFASSTGAWPIPFGFAGGLYDEDTGLVGFGARDCDPTVGRWTSKDPILFEGGQANLYAYIGNDPVNGIDPSGLIVVPGDSRGLELLSGLAGTGAGAGLLDYLHRSPVTYTVYGSRRIPDGLPGQFGLLEGEAGGMSPAAAVDQIVRVDPSLKNYNEAVITLGHELGHAALYDAYFLGRSGFPDYLDLAWNDGADPGGIADAFIHNFYWGTKAAELFRCK